MYLNLSSAQTNPVLKHPPSQALEQPLLWRESPACCSLTPVPMSSWSTSVLPLPPLRASTPAAQSLLLIHKKVSSFCLALSRTILCLELKSELSRAGFCCPPPSWTAQPTINSHADRRGFSAGSVLVKKGRSDSALPRERIPHCTPWLWLQGQRRLCPLSHCALMVLRCPDISDFSKTLP